MDQPNASYARKIMELCPQIALLKALLVTCKTPSARTLAEPNGGFRSNASVGRISFKWGQKMLRKWYLMTAEPEPLMTQ